MTILIIIFIAIIIVLALAIFALMVFGLCKMGRNNIDETQETDEHDENITD